MSQYLYFYWTTLLYLYLYFYLSKECVYLCHFCSFSQTEIKDVHKTLVSKNVDWVLRTAIKY